MYIRSLMVLGEGRDRVQKTVFVDPVLLSLRLRMKN